MQATAICLTKAAGDGGTVSICLTLKMIVSCPRFSFHGLMYTSTGEAVVTRAPCLARRYGNPVGEGPHAAPQPYEWGPRLTAAKPRLKPDSQTTLSK